MANKPFDPTKPVQCRDGRKARIICTDKSGERSIVALVASTLYDRERCWSFLASGRYHTQVELPRDLVNVPEVTTKIANAYRDSSGKIWVDYPGQMKLDFPSIAVYVGYVEWTFEDGEPTACRFVRDES